MTHLLTSQYTLWYILRKIIRNLLIGCAIFICFVVIIFFLIVVIFDPFKEWYVTEHLGGNYILEMNETIIYQNGQFYYDIIPFGVDRYSFNDKWIVVETKDLYAVYNGKGSNMSTGYQYWIIDKEFPIDTSLNNYLYTHTYCYNIATNGLIGPMDSTSLDSFMVAHNITLRFRKPDIAR